MSHLSDDVKVLLVKWYYQNNDSVVKVQRTYKKHFGVKRAPTRTTIKRVIEKFEKEGSIKESGHTGAPKSVRNTENIQRLREKLSENPRKSVRRLSQELDINRESVRRILKDDLKAFPFKIQMVQKQMPANKMQRLQFVNNMAQLIEDDAELLANIHFSDEAHFHLSGYVNKQNCRFWGTEQPFATVEEGSLGREKVTVWCALSQNEIIGPFFFEDDNQNAVTVDQHRP